MKHTLKETLDQFGINPEKIVDERQALVQNVHEQTFEATTRVIDHALKFAIGKGFGNASKLYVMQAAAEAGLYGVAIACTYAPDLKALKNGIPQDSLLFAGLLLASVVDQADPANDLNTAHAWFEKLTGRSFRDCFIETCGCKHCRARRRKHGIKHAPDRQDRWI